VCNFDPVTHVIYAYGFAFKTDCDTPQPGDPAALPRGARWRARPWLSCPGLSGIHPMYPYKEG
jgi:hypothetical protein